MTTLDMLFELRKTTSNPDVLKFIDNEIDKLIAKKLKKSIDK